MPSVSAMSSATPPSRTQLRILRVIAEFRRRDGYAPTVAEVGRHLGRTVQTIHEQIGVMQAKGLIDYRPAGHRSLRVLRPDLLPERRRLVFPILGEIS